MFETYWGITGEICLLNMQYISRFSDSNILVTICYCGKNRQLLPDHIIHYV